jgi:hypothetical protein
MDQSKARTPLVVIVAAMISIVAGILLLFGGVTDSIIKLLAHFGLSQSNPVVKGAPRLFRTVAKYYTNPVIADAVYSICGLVVMLAAVQLFRLKRLGRIILLTFSYLFLIYLVPLFLCLAYVNMRAGKVLILENQAAHPMFTTSAAVAVLIAFGLIAAFIFIVISILKSKPLKEALK